MSEIRVAGVAKVFPNGVRAVDTVDLDIGDGEFVVLVGPSGSGKSTLLRMIAGLEETSEGRIFIGGRDVTHEEPRARDIAMVFQNYALYPNMNVRNNIGFPLKMAKVPKNEIVSRVDTVARTLGLESLMDRRPRQLSGGQRQRVAMGRAMVREPQVFLMDEPLSNLDAKLRVTMRAELSRLHRRLGVTTVYVTHDQIEAMTLGQRVAVLRDGKLQQFDTPHNLYRNPANLFVAAFIGSPSMNLVEADVKDNEVTFGSQTLPLDPTAGGVSGRVALGIRPSDFESVATADPSYPRLSFVPEIVEDVGAILNVVAPVDAVRVTTEAALAANDTEASADGLLLADTQTRFVIEVPNRMSLSVGLPVEFAINPAQLYFFSLDSGENLIRKE